MLSQIDYHEGRGELEAAAELALTLHRLEPEAEQPLQRLLLLLRRLRRNDEFVRWSLALVRLHLRANRHGEAFHLLQGVVEAEAWQGPAITALVEIARQIQARELVMAPAHQAALAALFAPALRGGYKMDDPSPVVALAERLSASGYDGLATQLLDAMGS